MTWRNLSDSGWWAGGVAIALSFQGSAAIAQIIPDATLPLNSQVAPGCTVCPIEGGTIRGNNLFHSFTQFSIPTGGQALFNNPVSIQNILTRVTGSNLSTIDGLIQANGTANLFILNPNGIVFGQNARLQIGGSFVASTANAIQFGDQGFFSAINPESPGLLTINPSAFWFNRTPVGRIENQAIPGLQVPNGRSLLFVGGDLWLDRGRLLAPGGHIELGGLAESGAIGLKVNGSTLQLELPQGRLRGDVVLRNGADINARANNNGSITIYAQNLDLSGSSRIRTGIATTPSSALSRAGDITIDAIETVSVTDSSFISNALLATFGNTGDIQIRSGSLLLNQAAFISTSTFGRGNSGAINVVTRDDITIADGAFIATNVLGRGVSGDITIRAGGNIALFSSNEAISQISASLGSTGSNSTTVVGAGGNIDITAKTLVMNERSRINTSTFGRGNAGNITVDVQDSISLNGDSALFTTVAPIAIGNGGAITIRTGQFALTNGGELLSSTEGRGDAGNLFVTARQAVAIDGRTRILFDGRLIDVPSAVVSTVVEGAIGNGGNITITTPHLKLSDGGVVDAAARGQGNGGSITINANSLEAESGGQIVTSTFSNGKAGDITLNLTEQLTLTGIDSTYAARLAELGRLANIDAASGLFANTTSTSTGNGGNIIIDPQIIRVQDGAKIVVDSRGTGRGGSIEIQAGRLILDNGGRISAETASSQGGNISLNVDDYILLRRGSFISTTAGTAQAGGDGGNISIATKFVVTNKIENSDITANAFTGRGGNVRISAIGIYGLEFRPGLTPFSDITASSAFGISGTVLLDTPDLDPNRGLQELPADLADASNLINQTACRVTGSSEFVITGRSGVPDSPDRALNADSSWEDWRIEPGSEGVREQGRRSTTQHSPPIVEAQALKRDENGDLWLVAAEQPSSGGWWAVPNCQSVQSGG